MLSPKLVAVMVLVCVGSVGSAVTLLPNGWKIAHGRGGMRLARAARKS